MIQEFLVGLVIVVGVVFLDFQALVYIGKALGVIILPI